MLGMHRLLVLQFSIQRGRADSQRPRGLQLVSMEFGYRARIRLPFQFGHGNDFRTMAVGRQKVGSGKFCDFSRQIGRMNQRIRW